VCCDKSHGLNWGHEEEDFPKCLDFSFSVAFRIWGAATIPTRSRIAMHSALVHQLFLLLFFQVSGTVLVDLKQSTMRVDTIAWLMNAC
jgi:hypothetical protein